MVPGIDPKIDYAFKRLFGLERNGDTYAGLKPTVSIIIVNQTLFRQIDDAHLPFQLANLKHGLVFSNDVCVHLIELPKFDNPVEELSTSLDRWIYFLRNAHLLDNASTAKPG